MPSPLLDKSKAFVLQIIKVCNEVKKKKQESILTKQLIRTGSSICTVPTFFYFRGDGRLLFEYKKCHLSNMIGG